MDFRGEQYLLEKDRTLHQKSEVEFVQTQNKLAGESVTTKPADKVSDWLKILEQTHLSHHQSDPLVLERIKRYYHKEYIHPFQSEIVQGAARVEARAARELGHGEIVYEGNALAQRQEIALEDLEKSLDQWVDYLSNPSEPYPIWFRYYVFTNIVKLGSYDLEKKSFRKRGKDTFFPFPDIDRSALGHMQNIIECSKDDKALELFRKAQANPEGANTPESKLLTKEDAVIFANKSFADQYTEAINSNGEITPETRTETRGEWKVFGQGSEPDGLWSSLQNKGVPWCTRGYATARTQLEGGDFYVYYTLDNQGKATIPRIAIRMDFDRIGEVRGIADNSQNLEGNMTEIAEKKINELPGSEDYRKASADMKRLTTIENTLNKGGLLTKPDLEFIYEINEHIQGFGNEPDPRIDQIISHRNMREDYSNIYEVKPENIALSLDELNENTVVSVENSLIQLSYLAKTNKGMLKVLAGDIWGPSNPELLSSLNSLDRIHGKKAITYYIDKLTFCFNGSTMYGENTLRDLSQADDPLYLEKESSQWIGLATENIRRNNDSDSLRRLSEVVFAGNYDSTKDTVNYDYFFQNLTPESVDNILRLISESENTEIFSNLFIFIAHSSLITENQFYSLFSTIKNLPSEDIDSILTIYIETSRPDIKNFNKFPELVEFALDSNNEKARKFIEANHNKLNGKAYDAYNEYVFRDVDVEEMLLGRNSLK